VSPDPRATHEVTNQPPPLDRIDTFGENRPLVEAVRREAGVWALEPLHRLGSLAGTPAAIRWAREANENPPVLRTHDRYGNRIDEVEFHPAWDHLMEISIGHGIHARPWREPGPGAHAARAAAMIVMSGLEAGHGCPISMTYAAVPALRAEPEVAAEWEPKLTGLDYDPRLAPLGDKRAALAGMAMTEKQGGSDVRANTTRAEPLAEDGAYSLTGHKWFCSAPMSDAFLVLAQAPRGLTCFLLPRVLDDGSRNGFRIQRLKDKLGNRSNASAEIELDAAWARRVGEEGRGIATIIEMVNATRLDCLLGSTGLMRAAVAQASHHAAYREAFEKPLIEQPLMLNVLADLSLESEAATLLAMRLARAVDESEADAERKPFRRLGVAVGKYWICKSAVGVVAEAVECLGGNGYVEESGLPRLYRETPLNSIWEGSGNVAALDVLRAMSREPGSVEAFMSEIEWASGTDRRFDEAVARLKKELKSPEEAGARRLVELMAVALQASLILRYSTPETTDAFCASRLEADRGRAYGTLPSGVDAASIVERHRPIRGDG
jgi:putative acyl-CoA dehydrogenase